MVRATIEGKDILVDIRDSDTCPYCGKRFVPFSFNQKKDRVWCGCEEHGHYEELTFQDE